MLAVLTKACSQGLIHIYTYMHAYKYFGAAMKNGGVMFEVDFCLKVRAPSCCVFLRP